jgi:hypothetical protein
MAEAEDAWTTQLKVGTLRKEQGTRNPRVIMNENPQVLWVGDCFTQNNYSQIL